MLPVLAMHNSINSISRYAKPSGNRSPFKSLGVKFPNLQNVLSRELGRRAIFAFQRCPRYPKYVIGMGAVLSVCDVFEVLKSGVRFYAVFVVDLLSQFRRAQEGPRHKNMNGEGTRDALLAKTDVPIAHRASLGFYKSQGNPQWKASVSVVDSFSDRRLGYTKTQSYSLEGKAVFPEFAYRLQVCFAYLTARGYTAYISKIADFVQSFVRLNWFPVLEAHTGSIA